MSTTRFVPLIAAIAVAGCSHTGGDSTEARPDKTGTNSKPVNKTRQTSRVFPIDNESGPGPSAGEGSDPIETSVQSKSNSRTADENWPRFRGLRGAGVSTATGLPTIWSATKNVVWTTPLPGPGASSPIVWGERVYVTSFTGYGINPPSPGDKSKLKRHLHCVHRETGRILWTRSVGGSGIVYPGTSHQGIRAHGFASHTPVADDSGVYVFFGPSGVFAYSHSGKPRWNKSCGTKTAPYGSCMSPIVYRDLLIVNADVECGAIIAFDKRTGREKWRRGKNSMPGTSATPAVLKLHGKPQLVYCDAPYGSIAALDPLRGSVLWRGSLRISRVNACPLVLGNMLFFTGNPVSRSSAIQVGGDGKVKEIWSLNKGAYISSPLYHKGHFYWAKEQGGVVYCVDAKSGGIRYEKRLKPHSGNIYASPVVAEGRIYYVSQTRGTYVVAAKPTFELIAHNVIGTDKSIFNGSPAVSGGRLFLRSNKFLYCLGAKK